MLVWGYTSAQSNLTLFLILFRVNDVQSQVGRTSVNGGTWPVQAYSPLKTQLVGSQL